MTKQSREFPQTARASNVPIITGVVAVLATIGVGAYCGAVWVASRSAHVEPPRTVAAPLRTADSVFLMTSQHEARVTGGGSKWTAFRGLEKVTHVDVWRLDAKSARAVWRKRLFTEHEGNVVELGLLGVDDDRLWVFVRQPLLLSIEDGKVVADALAIAARNASLKGAMPRHKRDYLFFEGHGLVFTAADARPWLVDVQTLVSVPWQGRGPMQRETAIGPQHFTPHTIGFQKRGVTLSGRWIGVFREDEANKPMVPDLLHAGPRPYRLWQAKAGGPLAVPYGWAKTPLPNMAMRARYSNFSVVEGSPEFFDAGLMSDGRSPVPLLLTAPDSVLILHRDRSHEAGRLRVTRITAPGARVLWDVPLPLSSVHSVMPGKDDVVLFGRAHVPNRERPGDRPSTAPEWLVHLNMEDGAIRSFNVSAAALSR